MSKPQQIPAVAPTRLPTWVSKRKLFEQKLHDSNAKSSSMSKPLQMTAVAPTRAPTWVSKRRLFELMLLDLHKCTNLNDVKQIHAQILKQNLHRELDVAPKLILAFSLCHQTNLAINVFNQFHYPNLRLYNALIRAHVLNSQPSLAFAAFLDMQRNGISADNFTYTYLFKACDGPSWFPVVQMVHSHVVKRRFFGDLYVPNSLIDCYSKCDALGFKAAMKLFMVMGEKDTVSWNSMIGGLVRAGELSEARKLFDEMPVRDAFSWNTILDAYVKAGAMDEAFELFEKIPGRNVVSWSTMVGGYCKAGDLQMARMFFDKMPVKNVVTWTAIISGYAQHGQAKEAIRLFKQMEAAGLKLDDETVYGILAACAEAGLLGLGRRVHASVEGIRFKWSVSVSNALIDMYAKCGRVDTALSIFDGMSKRDLVSWNTMLHGLAMHGRGEKAFNLFARMKQEGFKPDNVTLVGVLCACTHAGFVDEGLHYFNNMERDHGIVPRIEHYGCMVDLLGRGGRLEDAFRLVQSMPMEPNEVIWGTLLGACRTHNAVELAQKVLDHLNKLEPSDPGNYSMLSNIFAGVCDWNTVANVRLQMKSLGIKKPSGSSSIEVDGDVHKFAAFDESHPNSDKIYQMIDRLGEDMKEVGHVPKLSVSVFQSEHIKRCKHLDTVAYVKL